MIPDHSVLYLEIVTTYAKDVNDTLCSNILGQLRNNVAGSIGVDDMYFKRYDVRSVPVDFFVSDVTRQALIMMIGNSIKFRVLKKKWTSFIPNYARCTSLS